MDGYKDDFGVIQRAILELFETSAKTATTAFTFSITMLEIYNETIRDLLLVKSKSSFTLDDVRLDVRH